MDQMYLSAATRQEKAAYGEWSEFLIAAHSQDEAAALVKERDDHGWKYLMIGVAVDIDKPRIVMACNVGM
jgi:hypothetical protein